MKQKIRALAVVLTACAFLAGAAPGAAASDETASYPVTNPFNPLAQAGVILGGHYAYCVDEHNPWPDEDGIEYEEAAGMDGISDAQQAQLARALEAGYPLDVCGLTAREPALAAQTRGTYTQWVIWAVLGSPTYLSYIEYAGSAYATALYAYAETGLVDGQAPAAVSAIVHGALSALQQGENGARTGTLTFQADRVTPLVIGSIPAGLTLRNGEAELAAGDAVSSADTLSVTAAPGFAGGEVRFSYTVAKPADGTLHLFATTATAADRTYQRLIGLRSSTETLPLTVPVPAAPTATAVTTPAPTATATATAGTAVEAPQTGDAFPAFLAPCGALAALFAAAALTLTARRRP